VQYCASRLCKYSLVGFRYVKTCTCISWNDLCPYTDTFGAYNKAVPFKGKWSVNSAYTDNPGGIAGEGGDRADVGSTSTRNTHFTFACRDSSMTKCAERLGYKPWKTITTYVPDTDPDYPPAAIPISLGGDPTNQYLNDYHQACVRMLRADYCGDGVAHTITGTQVDVFDCAKGQDASGTGCTGVQNSSTSWGLEAEWGADGAKCVSSARWDQAFTADDVGGIFVPNAACPNIATCPNMRAYLNATCYDRATDMVKDVPGRPCFSPASMTPFAYFGQQRAALASKADNLADQPGMPWSTAY
jgi:hypothetical protein